MSPTHYLNEDLCRARYLSVLRQRAFSGPHSDPVVMCNQNPLESRNAFAFEVANEFSCLIFVAGID